ncbi:MAG: DinB family protein [Acidobacteriota bacterium]
MEIVDPREFLRYYERIRARTRRVVVLIPPEALENGARPGRFTLGDLVRHLAAIERYMFAENACCRPSRYPGHGRELGEGLPAVLEYFDRCHAESMEIFGGLSDEDYRALCETPGGTKLAVWKWLRAMVEHEIHHRGQIYLMLGALDVTTPPLYGLTSEEVLARSQ